jgi:transposase InsO family protein
MTHPEFRKFRWDWGVFKALTEIPSPLIAAQIYNNCDTNVQNAIINSSSRDFFKLTEDEILNLVEKIVTKRSNPSVHRLAFSSLAQSENEPVKDFVVRLKSSARDCEFVCPSCKHDLIPGNVKDQLVRGLHNGSLQTDILAKADTLTDLDAVVKHAESFEVAIHDQAKLQDSADVMGARVSEYKRANQARINNSWSNQQPAKDQQQQSHDAAGSGHHQQRTPQSQPANRDSRQHSKGQQQRKRMCPGCGSTTHLVNRNSDCPAWGQRCHNCDTANHFASVCRQPKRDSARAILLAHAQTDDEPQTSSADNSRVQFIPAELTPYIGSQPLPTRTLEIFPDSGAEICIGGTCHLRALGVDAGKLIPCNKRITAVGGSSLICRGWIPVDFSIGSSTTRQPLYICDKVTRLYFGRKGCTDLSILPDSFPFPMEPVNVCSASEPSVPERPTALPFAATEENVPRLKKFLIETFEKTVFSRGTPFRSMNCPPAHIHLKDDAQPHAVHIPYTIPIHYRDEVKRQLDRDVEDGIIEPAPIGEPVVWCSPMVVTAKGDGSPRRVVDFQRLNKQCLRETHHCASPFQLASQIPRHTRKTVLDATDGYHAIELDNESQKLTTFISIWGRYRYLRLPQGYSAAQDAYTRRYDEIIKDVPDKVKCIDDTLLHAVDIESAFFQAFDYLVLCANNGITINVSKFQFCQNVVTFAGLKITPEGICPSDKVIVAIKEFPVPKDITGARSWFGLVNQIAWAYAVSPIMQPFRDLVKPNNTFYWDSSLDKIFAESKELLVRKCTEGIQTFDCKRNTCLQSDWSKEGIGYLLLQQHCNCDIAKAPVCCKDGWRLVFAGSRFTSDAETRYSPTEGEALAVAWSLEHARMFVVGCQKLLISTDHKPLLGILKDRDLGSITSTRLFSLKERTLPYMPFNIQYNPGKWHRGPDAMSRNPVVSAFRVQPGPDDLHRHTEHVESMVEAHSVASMAAVSAECDPLVALADIRNAASRDVTHVKLTEVVQNGFPVSRDKLPEELRTYWSVRDKLSFRDSLMMMGDRIVVPSVHRKSVLNTLHSAHQGTSSMMSRARSAVYWPGIDADIRNKRYTCHKCNEIAPSNSKEPLILSPPPLYPFQQICLDYFELGHYTYLICVDRFSGWIIVHYYPNEATSRKLISACREIFMAYGVAEEASTDGGPQFKSHEFSEFLKRWGITHRISSAYYPQSNGRAELAVKSAKRIIRENTLPNGSLDSDKAVRALLQHRNTPLADLGLSPAQLLLHRKIRDHIPVDPSHYQLHSDWILSAEERERMTAERDKSLCDAYNATAHPLQPLVAQTPVMIQTKGKWDRSGRIVEVLQYRQYRVRVNGSGRVTLRNRRFLRPIAAANCSTMPAQLHPSGPEPTEEPQPHTPAQSVYQPSPPDSANELPQEPHPQQHDASEMQPAYHAANNAPPARPPKALRELRDYNSPGLADTEPVGSGRTRSGRQ